MVRLLHVTVPVLVVAVVLSMASVGVSVGAPSLDSPTAIDACTTITEPGVYELTADVEDAPPGDQRACLDVRSGNITIDGNGHTLGTVGYDSLFVGTAVPFTPNATPLPNVTVRNVTVTGDVEVFRAPRVVVRNVTAQDAYISVSHSEESVVVDNVAIGTTERGASIGLSWADGSVAENNTVQNGPKKSASGHVFSVSHSENVTVDDTLVRGGGAGVNPTGLRNSTITDTTVVGSDDAGVVLKWQSQGNVVENTTVRDSRRGVVVSQSTENRLRNTTVQNVSGQELDIRDAGLTQVEQLHLDSSVSGDSQSNVTLSLTGQHVAIERVESPPTIPQNLTPVGGFVSVTEYRGSALSLEVAYDESRVDAAGQDEREVRLYRSPDAENPRHVYAPMVATGPVSSTEWTVVPDSNVNTTANVVYTDVSEYEFTDPDTPTDATPISAGDTVDGFIVSEEVDWYAVDVEAGEAILPTLSLVGPLEDRTLRLTIVDPDGENIRASPADGMLGDFYSVGEEWPEMGRQAQGAATAETNGTHYVGVRAGFEPGLDSPGAYNLTVETREADSFAPNQRRETATPLTDGDRVNETAAPYDEDWFSFTAEAGEQVTLDTRLTDPLTVSVYGPDGDVLAEVDASVVNPPGVHRVWNITATQSGTYYVHFHQSEFNMRLRPVGTYDLTLQKNGTDGDETDGDDGDSTDGDDTDGNGDDGDDGVGDGDTGDGDDADGGGTDGDDSDSDGDADGDGLTNADERERGTDPSVPDTDGDGLTDGQEVELGTDSTAPDTDGDGVSDCRENRRGTDPSDPDSN